MFSCFSRVNIQMKITLLPALDPYPNHVQLQKAPERAFIQASTAFRQVVFSIFVGGLFTSIARYLTQL